MARRDTYLEVSLDAVDQGHLIGRDPRDLSHSEFAGISQNRPVGMKAIRAKCLDCACSQAEVRKCVVFDCPLWPLRMGSVPKGWRNRTTDDRPNQHDYAGGDHD